MSTFPPNPPTSPQPSPAAFNPDDARWFQPYFFGNAFEAGWAAFKGRYGLLLGATLIYLLFAAASILIALVDQAIFGPDAAVEPLSTLFDWLVLGPVLLGTAFVGVAAVRGDPVGISAVFIAFGRYPTVIGITLLTTLIMLVVDLLTMVPVAIATSTPGSGGGTLLLIVFMPIFLVIFVAAIYVSLRLWFAGVVAVDPRAPAPGAIDSIKLSWGMTRGISLSLFCLGIVLVLIGLASFLLLILPGIFFGLPLATAVWGAAYAMIAAQKGITPIAGACPTCGYPDGGGDTCPECGHRHQALGAALLR